MSKEVKFYICKHCGNIVGLIHNAGVPLVCCGEKMSELVPNTTEAATEKHLPVVEMDGNIVKVSVGSVEHPSTEEHYISRYILRRHMAASAKPSNRAISRRYLCVAG